MVACHHWVSIVSNTSYFTVQLLGSQNHVDKINVGVEFGVQLSMNISMNISLSGNNIFQTGNTVTPFTVNSDTGSVGILGYNEPDVFHNLLTSVQTTTWCLRYMLRRLHGKLEELKDLLAPSRTS